MNRRSLLKYATMFGVGQVVPVAGAAISAPATAGHNSKGVIVLYCDLAVDPAREQEMLNHFHGDFKPAAQKFDGFIDLKMLKLRTIIQGGPALAKGINYRFQLTYESEEKRQKWIASSTHKRVWPLIENTVLNKDYLVLLTDSM
jgi:heme-degrading monooxygenase HmoA